MTSVAILGSGGVGVACAGPLLQLGLASEVILYDLDGDRARGEALDFQHAAPLLPECSIEGGPMDSIRAADIAVLTLANEPTKLRDCVGGEWNVNQRLAVRWTIRAGEVCQPVP